MGFIHLFFTPAHPMAHGVGELESIPAAFSQEAEYILDRSPVHYRNNMHTHTHSCVRNNMQLSLFFGLWEEAG